MNVERAYIKPRKKEEREMFVVVPKAPVPILIVTLRHLDFFSTCASQVNLELMQIRP